MDPALVLGTIWKGSHHDTELLGDGNDRWSTRLNGRGELSPFDGIQVVGSLCIAIRDSISDPQGLIRVKGPGSGPYMRAKGVLGGSRGWTSCTVCGVSHRNSMHLKVLTSRRNRWFTPSSIWTNPRRTFKFGYIWHYLRLCEYRMFGGTFDFPLQMRSLMHQRLGPRASLYIVCTSEEPSSSLRPGFEYRSTWRHRKAGGVVPVYTKACRFSGESKSNSFVRQR
jgi:hypothetical protein